LRRILGVDFGSARIGIAISDPLNIIARGLSVIQQGPDAIERIRALAAEHDVERIVVGMPFNLKGEKGVKALEVEAFIVRLRDLHVAEIIPWDERFTSSMAHDTLREMGVPQKKRRQKGLIDEMAAALILQGYLDAQTRQDTADANR